ncbi:MAG: FapA family protein [Spirochaetes bacterium]|nr:FapA family protein [Spirochaetota bacterium]MBU1081750.1 FapA family protein [Spirochaetota bacterium]
MDARIGFEAVRELMRRYMDEDGDKRSVVAEGATVEEALKSAAVQLDCPVARIEYDVLEKGMQGFIGIGSKRWKISAYEAAVKKKVEAEFDDSFDAGFDLPVELKPLQRDVDGQAFVRLASDGALLKVTPPVGKGKKASEKLAVDKLHARAIRDFDEALVKETIKAASSEWVHVGSFIANPAADALLTVELGSQEMEARVVITPPQPGGCDLSKDVILAYLRNNKVVFGVIEEALQALEDAPRFKEPILVAQGQKPVNGEDGRIQFMFETDRTKLNLEEKNGKVDYKELHLVQNVVEGQALARKIQAQQGVPGRTVTGKLLPAKNGKDLPLPLGKNVHASDDGLTIIADVNGEATYINSKINVETVYTIAGDVDLKSGNQFFLGTIVVVGNVEDGFSVKATGNIEVRGNVGKAEISAEGDVIVHQGITGKGAGSVTAGKNVWAKFIENANVTAGENVIVQTSIINSEVTAEKRIVCSGQKHASIIGGRYRACEEINAKSIGSPSGGAETILEVGSDPKSKAKMDEIDSKQKVLQRQLDELDKNIYTMNETKRQRKSLPDDKQAVLDELVHKRDEIGAEASALKAEYDTIQAYLNNLKVRGKVSVSGRIYPGTEIVIRDIREKIKNEYKGLTFYLENMMVKTTRYEEFDDEILKKGPPDAHKAD